MFDINDICKCGHAFDRHYLEDYRGGDDWDRGMYDERECLDCECDLFEVYKDTGTGDLFADVD